MTTHQAWQTMVEWISQHWLLERLFFGSMELMMLAAAVALLIRLVRMRTPRLTALLWALVLVKPLCTLAVGSPFYLVEVPVPPVQSVVVGLRALAIEPTLSATETDATPAISTVSSAFQPVAIDVEDSSAEKSVDPSNKPIQPLEITAAAPTPKVPSPWQLRWTWVAWLWGAGACLMLLRAGLLRLYLLRLLAKCESPDAALTDQYLGIASSLGLRRPPKLLVTNELESPALVGMGRSYVLVPKWLLSQGEPRALAWSLRHELTHWKHGDLWLIRLRELALTAFYFHPVAWWAGKRLEEAMELACDRAVIANDGEAADYAQRLYEILDVVRNHRRQPLSAGLFATRSQIARRLVALVEAPLRLRPRLSRRGTFGIVLTSAIVLTVGIGLQRKAPGDETSSPVATSPESQPNETNSTADQTPREEEPDRKTAETDASEQPRVSEGQLLSSIYGMLGAELRQIQPQQFQELKTRYRGGLSVEKVLYQSAAEQGGIQQGDVLLGLDRFETTSLQDVQWVLRILDRAPTIKFYILRNGDTMYGQLSLPQQKLAYMPHGQTPELRKPAEGNASIPPIDANLSFNFDDVHQVSQLTGRVVDLGDKPVKGAIVAFQMTGPLQTSCRQCHQNLNGLPSNLNLVTETTSKSDGRFELKRLGTSGVTFALTADKSMADAVNVTSDQKSVSLRLQRLKTATGTVSGLDGEPIANCVIRYRPTASSTGQYFPALAKYFVHTTNSDSLGKFTLTGLLPSYTYSIDFKPSFESQQEPKSETVDDPAAKKTVGEFRLNPRRASFVRPSTEEEFTEGSIIDIKQLRERAQELRTSAAHGVFPANSPRLGAVEDPAVGAPGTIIEFRLAELEPADGLVEATVEGSQNKVYLHREVLTSFKDLVSVGRVTVASGQVALEFTFRPEAAAVMERETSAHLRKPLAVLVNGKLMATPRITSAIRDKAQVTGFGESDLKQILRMLSDQDQKRLPAILVTEKGTPSMVVATPVHYQDQMLVVSRDDEVMAVAFDKELERGVNYRFRHLKNGEKETAGSGGLIEGMKIVLDVETGRTDRTIERGDIRLRAGKIEMVWSYGGAGRGWIYYEPTLVRVQSVSADNFDTVDLKAFLRTSD